MTLRVFSSGGGVQSTAALVLSAEGRIDFPIHLFSNVGDDSEYQGTLDYVREVSMPYAERHGIEFHELTKVNRAGEPVTLLGELKRQKRSVMIPVRMANGSPGNRRCTPDFKLAVVAKWSKANGATPDDPAIVGIGFTTDEIERLGRSHHRQWERPSYPLLDLRLSRADCLEIIRKAGLPQPPKSACWFCPFHKPSTWAEMRRDEPDLFNRAVELERYLTEKRASFGKDAVFFTRFGRPLDEAVGEAQATLFDDHGGFETCDEGVCFI